MTDKVMMQTIAMVRYRLAFGQSRGSSGSFGPNARGLTVAESSCMAAFSERVVGSVCPSSGSTEVSSLAVDGDMMMVFSGDRGDRRPILKHPRRDDCSLTDR